MASSVETLVRDLHRRRGRERRGYTLAEGVRLVEDAVAAGVECRAALVSPGLEGTERGRALKRAMENRGWQVVPITDAELEALAATEQPQGVLAVVRPPRWQLEEIVVNRETVLLVLDGVQDPGNVGTMVRTALALGAGGLVALPGTVELFNPKVLRASMGAVFRLPICSVTVEELSAWAARLGVTLVGTGVEGEPFARAALPKPLALILGNEGAGLSEPIARSVARTVSIPITPGAESLNVAVAAGILLYGVLRG